MEKIVKTKFDWMIDDNILTCVLRVKNSEKDYFWKYKTVLLGEIPIKNLVNQICGIDFDATLKALFVSGEFEIKKEGINEMWFNMPLIAADFYKSFCIHFSTIKSSGICADSYVISDKKSVKHLSSLIRRLSLITAFEKFGSGEQPQESSSINTNMNEEKHVEKTDILMDFDKLKLFEYLFGSK